MTPMRIGVLFVAGFLVSGCTGAGDEDLLQWMAEQKAQTKPKVVPISEPKQFKPESYTQVSAVEPFSREKLTQALRRAASQVASNGALVAPELARRQEPREAFPLDSMPLRRARCHRRADAPAPPAGCTRW